MCGKQLTDILKFIQVLHAMVAEVPKKNAGAGAGAACLRVEAWVVWISKSNRSELKERKGPAAMLGLSAIATRTVALRPRTPNERGRQLRQPYLAI
jgi:hypothetical protein